MDINVIIDISKVRTNEDGSVTVGSDCVTHIQKFLEYNPIVINGDFLLELLTDK